jgi:chlorite dismutase
LPPPPGRLVIEIRPYGEDAGDLDIDDKTWHNVSVAFPTCFVVGNSPLCNHPASMEIVNRQKEGAEVSGLRLVADDRDAAIVPSVEKQFVNYTFLRINPEWRKLDAVTKNNFKAEFTDVFERFRRDFLLYTYSLVGFDSKADLMIWRIGDSLDLVQEMTASLYRTQLGSFIETVDNYLSVTKGMMFVDGGSDDRHRVEAGAKKYHFLYPCAKHKGWFEISEDERDALIEEGFMVGKRFPNIRIHMTHAFGVGDQQYIISFETDEPKDFLALAEELGNAPASKFRLRGMPIYTCRQRPLTECLDALG